MTTSPFITLTGVSYALPDGRTLFSNLHDTFDHCPTGLVGRNGVGKSILARVMAGQLAPSAGRVLPGCRIRYLPQLIVPQAHSTVADLAGLRATLDALARIEAGTPRRTDVDIVAGLWDTPRRLRVELAACGLAHLDADTPAARLSGGECTRVALLGAFLSGARFLILDEPTNHLDRDNRRQLAQQLARWCDGLLVISHDRELLDGMERIVELSPQGLTSFGAGFTGYSILKQQAEAAAQSALDHARAAHRRSERELHEQAERQARREAGGRRAAKCANQAKILLDKQKARSQATSARARLRQDQVREQSSRALHEAAARVDTAADVVLHTPDGTLPAARRVLSLEALELPFGPADSRTLSLSVHGPRRVAVSGPNGCGKSTLLRVLAGELRPRAGHCEVGVPFAYLDQHLSGLDTTRSVVEQLAALNPALDAGTARTRLARLGLGADKALSPAGRLSGGERLKAALACALYGETPAQLLLLDEPTNHLDLDGLAAIETMLRQYRGALLVVSHDERFLETIEPTDRLCWAPEGWGLTAAC